MLYWYLMYKDKYHSKAPYGHSQESKAIGFVNASANCTHAQVAQRETRKVKRQRAIQAAIQRVVVATRKENRGKDNRDNIPHKKDAKHEKTGRRKEIKKETQRQDKQQQQHRQEQQQQQHRQEQQQQEQQQHDNNKRQQQQQQQQQQKTTKTATTDDNNNRTKV